MPQLLAPAKLTLSLRIVGVRPDGYHELEAEMVTIDLADEITLDPDSDGLEIVGAGSGLDVVADADNSVSKALRVAGRTAGVRLLKHIPAGAGLGGGSADAAAVLRWAGCTDPAVTVELGADVPFCVVGGRARVTGIGEKLEALPVREETYTLCIPPFGCSTPAVYRAWDELGGPQADGPNDLVPAALAVEPRLATWRDRLRDATGIEPVMAGSGSTWFVPGAFPGDDRIVVRTTDVLFD